MSAADQIRAMLGPLDGDRIPGGCDRCDAYQTIARVEYGIWKLTVHHDGGCPELARHTKRKRRRSR